ncbi:MAG: DUF2309 family protein [Nitrospirae bacterium]|nr:MAG: DUF2309 family protein [Nitrospirota bacterium]
MIQTAIPQEVQAEAVVLTPAQREHLHAQIACAGEVVAPNWPIRTFISRNPLSGFEAMTFDMAIRRARELYGGRGLLSLDEYRDLWRQGRILEHDVQAAIEKFWPAGGDLHLLGSHIRIRPVDVLKLHALYGLNGLHPRVYQWTVSHGGALTQLRADVPEAVKKRTLSTVNGQLQQATHDLPKDTTLADYFEMLTGLNITRWIAEAVVHDHLRSLRSRKARLASHYAAGSSHVGETHPFPSLFSQVVGNPEAYRMRLQLTFERLAHSELPSSLTCSEFTSRWLEHEARLLPALAEYLVGRPLAFKRWPLPMPRPEQWYLKCLWISVLNAVGAVDPLLPEAVRVVLPGFRKGVAREPNPGLTSVSLNFIRPLSEWVSELSGEDLVGQLNDFLIRWCSAFLDEGMASWAMPERSRGFYRAWKTLIHHDYSLVLRGLVKVKRMIEQWPDHPADAIVASLRRMGIPQDQWEEYFRRHLVQLPGWVGFIRWRMQHPELPQQQHAPIDTVEYLAVRLFYEMALTDDACEQYWGIPGSLDALESYCRSHGHLLRDLQEHSHGALGLVCEQAWRLFHLAQFLGWTASDIQTLSPKDCELLLAWLDRLPEDRQGLIWQEAYEAPYRRHLLAGLENTPPETFASSNTTPVLSQSSGKDAATRPQAQAVFCIDVRSEPLRRHLEAQGPYETIGFAGFFGVPLCYQGFGSEEPVALCPVLIKPQNVVQEVPRGGQERQAERFTQGCRWWQFSQYLFHELKSHPITSFLLIDVTWWMFGIALVGKTLFPVAFRRALSRLKQWVQPQVSTWIPLDKLSKEEAECALDEQERASIRNFLRQSPRWRLIVPEITPDLVDALRQYALAVRGRRVGRTVEWPPLDVEMLSRCRLTEKDWRALIQDIRQQCGVTMENRELQLDKLSAVGFILTEQVFMVERALQLTGLTSGFGRLVLWCGHGSITENNPYAAAYDCGACGGNHGGPNARVLAAMANKPEVREQLRARGIEIPSDTWFLAGEHNTTIDQVVLFDREDIPLSHREDVQQLEAALARASLALARERCRRLPGAPRRVDGQSALHHTYRRSVDWAQIRPEWGLSGNAAFIIAPRSLTRHLNLQGRTFLHNYHASQDESGKVLETIMTAPLVVAEWINLQYFFSAVDPWVYGSGSKVLHNVVSGVGVMLGAHADFQPGLPLQTVRDGSRLFHEPLRLLVVIQAPLQTISRIISQHTILQYFFHHGWVLLVAIDPASRIFYEYQSNGEWRVISHSSQIGDER